MADAVRVVPKLKVNGMSDIILPGRQAELENLLNTFFKSYPDSEEGRRHLPLYERGRKEGPKHYGELVTASARGGDVTDDVLLPLLSREKGTSLNSRAGPLRGRYARSSREAALS